MRRDGHVIVYNGEIYNFRGLRAGPNLRETPFETDGDTEVLLRLLMRDGAASLAHANGMWAYCMLDEGSGQLTAGRDRYGKKPLFYFQDANTICFASEAKAISAYLQRSARMRVSALDSYLAHGWLFPGDGTSTHLVDVQQVPAGGTVEVDLYSWTLSSRRAADTWPTPEDDTSADALSAILSDAVRLRLTSDRPIGLLLSGGVDSSLILSILKTLGLADRVRCYVGDAGKSEDADYAKACLQQLSLPGTVIPIEYGREGLDRFLRVCRHQEKPFPLIGNVLGLPQLYEAIAADNVPVVLDGTGADEIFGGYPERTLPLAIADAFARGDHGWIAELAAAHRDEEGVAGLIEASVAALKRAPHKPILSQLPPRTAPDEPDLGHLLHDEVRLAASSDPLVSFHGQFTEGLCIDATRGRMQEWLWQNDRTAMQSSVENRSPFLDFRLKPWIFTAPRHKLVAQWTKHELRMAFDSFRPLPTQWRRQKQGFRWVYGRFLRANREELLALVASSKLLRPRLHVAELIDKARADDVVLLSEVMQRAVCIAGLEAELGLKL